MDPESGCIVAQGHSCPTHPLKHAIMVCIDAVAETQGGGAWHASNGSLLQQRQRCLAGDGDKTIAVLDKEPPAKKHKPSKQYLCTGYDAYVTVEPCVMYVSMIVLPLL